MSLDSAKLGDSSLHQDTQKAPAFSLPACPPPRWSDFYQIPIENDIIDGTDWIDFLWEVLHRATPPTYRASKSFAFTFRRLGEHVTDLHISKLSLIWFLTNSIRTKTLHVIYDILEHWGYLESACPGLIDDILQEIKVNASDTMTFSVDLRHRCQTAGLELDHKMRMLQAIVNRQHRDFNPKNLLKTIAYLICGALAIFALVLVPLLPWVSSESPIDTWLPYIGLIGLHMIPTASRAYSPALDIAYRIDDLNTKTFQLIWAVRDVAGLLTLISESESSPLSDVLHAERFLKAFQTSFLGGRQELSDLRSWLQQLPSWTDKNFNAHHWTDRHVASSRDNNLLPTHYIVYRVPSTHTRSILPRIPRLSSMTVTRVYQKVFGMHSHNDVLPTVSSQRAEYQNRTANTKTSDAALVPVSTASEDGISMAIPSYSLAVEDYA